MDDNELILHLKSLNKPYNHIVPKMAQSSFSTTIIRYETGLLKPKTFNSFCNKFGFIKIGNTWKSK